MKNLVLNYFEKLKSYSNFRFILELTLLAFLLKIIFGTFGVLLGTALGIDTSTDLKLEEDFISKSIFLIFILTSLYAFIETLTGQWLIIWFTSKFTKKLWIQIIASALVFAALHIDPVLIAGTFPIGVILAWSFIVKSKKSIWEALWVTTAIHVLHNLLVLLLFWKTAELIKI